MIKNYIILAHRNPQQLYRMIQHLQDENSYFYIHLDLKCTLSDFEFLTELKHVTFIEKRVNCIWGDFSIVKSTLNLIENVINDGRGGFTILMSGQDYPIKSNEYITKFFKENSEFNFIDVIPIEKKWSKKMVKDKVENYHILHSEKRSDSNCYAPFYAGDTKSKLRTLLHFTKGRLSRENFNKIVSLPKRIPLFENQFAGSQWWALNEKTLKKIFYYVQENYSELERYYSFTSSPDEIFFQTLVMNIIEEDERGVKPSVTYVNWERKNCPLPVTYVVSDFEELKKQSHLFARKFDTDIDAQILDQIDVQLLAN